MPGADPVDIYLSCACLCAKTFRTAGATFCLVTNDARAIRGRLEQLELSGLPVDQLRVSYSGCRKGSRFTRPTSSSIFSAGSDPESLEQCWTCGSGYRPAWNDYRQCSSLGVYDISEQVLPIHEQSRIVADMKRISGKSIPEARWYGGEFVTGSASMFRAISSYIEMFWENYIQNIGSLVHIGDEMIMSAALNCMRLDGISLVDYGKDGSVVRWWSSRTRHQQPPFDSDKGCCPLASAG